MHLKSIDIVGYKSFADKTSVDLEPGITGVIGPNGCGKSNVMEAVRWCLGETSWKSLRADSMADVIFSGTTRRSPQSLAEVTLTFDNANSILPLEYSEVTITRRLFRSGESQYFLNKTQCRLRDIREMFLDTGLGGDGYAIIDQGGVDSMIRAKPVERRAFFEEAAGVAKYNAKREEALRKLDRVDMDLGRLRDSVALIEEQVKKLDSDARRAKLYAKYKEELAAMEAVHIVAQTTLIDEELSSLREISGPLEEALGKCRCQISAEGANLAALNLEKTSEQSRLIDVNRKVAEVKTVMGRLEERVRSSEQSILGMNLRVEACRVEVQADSDRADLIDPEISIVAASIATAEASLAEARSRVETAGAELAAIEAAVSAEQEVKDNFSREAGALDQDVYELGRRAAAAESEFSRAEVSVRAGLKSLERDRLAAGEARGRLDEARAEAISAETAYAAAKTVAVGAEARAEEFRAHQGALSEETVALRSALAQTLIRAESLENQGGQNPYWIGAQAVLGANIAGVVGTVHSLFRVDDSLKPELEDLLGERLYAIVVEDSTAARLGVELLQASGAGRARFLVLSSLPDAAEKSYPAGARSLLSRLRYDPRHEKAMRHLFIEAYELGGKLFGEHWVFGGAAAKDGPQATLVDLGEIKAKAATLELRGASLAEERARVETELTQALQAARLASAAQSQEFGRRHGLEAHVNGLEQSLANHERNVDLSLEESARALAEAALAKELISEQRKRRAETQARVDLVRLSETRAAQTLAVAREELSGRRAVFAGQDERCRGVEQELLAYSGSRKRLDDERAVLESAIARLADESAELSRRKAATLELQEVMRAEISSFQIELAGHENEAKSVFSGLQDLQNKIDALSAAVKRLQAEHDQAQADLHQHEVHASALKSKCDLLKTRLWDERQMTVEEAKTKHVGIVADVEKIEVLRRRIAGMGNINMAAPEEYEALAQKQTFLQSQISDLMTAKEDLKAAIVKINNATRENFRQTFTEVREHFRRLYGVLFEGGEADLILTDPDNILETGVDIVAQPPGKKLQSITLLSGGEKTLTAVALLFAFFMVKPSPFCMLDEADAALDDANIERFVALLREFQNKTQFLIVSHNKRTMEAADVIYGVTMEEKGISQLISVDFRKKVGGTEREATKEKVVSQGPFA